MSIPFFFLLAMVLIGSLSWDAAAKTTIRGEIIRQSEHNAAMLEQTGIIGLQFVLRTGMLPVVVAVYPQTPAERSGIQPGDVLMVVNRHSVEGWSRTQLDVAISDVPGETVHLWLSRHGQVFASELTVQAVQTLPLSQIRHLYTP
jgi:C-terminal processing protease CtpA/Prc